MPALIKKEVINIARTRASHSVNYQQLTIKTIQDKLPYFLLGASILIVLYLIFAGIFSRGKMSLKKATVTPAEEKAPTQVKKYVVKNGDYLWKIAEESYGSGFNAYDIAAANKIANPSIINPGQELVLPTVTPKQPTTGEVAKAVTTGKITITGNQYTVQRGDYLWKIAQEAYGDGFAWMRIAQANKLANPNLIHAGNVFVIPRQ